MTNKEILEKISDLAKLDVDAIKCYEQAVKQLDDSSIRMQLETFRDDHRRHVASLNAIIRRMGGEEVSFTPDVMGFLTQGFTALRSITGTDGALKAMETNEKLTNRKYKQACDESFPLDVAQTIRSNFDDEQRHLAFIQESLSVRK